MGFIRTLMEDIPKEEMGFTYSHEHIVCVPEYWRQRNEDDLLLDDPEKSKRDVIDFFSLGGKCIVDATAIDYGRRVDEVANISKETGVRIIGTAGFNKSMLWNAKIRDGLKELIGPYETYWDWIRKESELKLTDFVIREIEEGLEGTTYRAGQVKFGMSYNQIFPEECKTLRVAANAHFATKAPIHVHTEAGTMALEIIELLKAENVKLEHVCFGHMDRNLDSYYHSKIADTGAYLSFDGVGKIKYAPESARIASILELVKRGYEDQILISGDTARKSYYKHYSYGLGLEFIIKKWIPRFEEEANALGYDGAKLIKKFFIENPRNCFAFKESV